MKKLLLVNLLFCGFLSTIKATDNLRSPDVRTLGMGGNGVVHSSLFNPSLLAIRTKKELRIDYYNRYSLKELAAVSGGLCFFNKILPIGLHAASFGYDEYRESLFRLSAGKQLNSWCSLGISAQYVILQSDLFETDASRFSTDIGVTLCPVDNWLIGLSIINCATVSLSDEDIATKHMTPFLVQAGFNWEFINNLLITGGATYQEETPFSASVGMEYTPFTDFQLRAGVKTNPLLPSLGASYRLSIVMADVVMIYHPVLGISTGIGLSISF
ncbi:MAG: hypothetical protein LBV72_03625 [Tannerella sp.]|jgi:hypothetical protein|nr:hypothetical protein [Tannerella sp.]